MYLVIINTADPKFHVMHSTAQPYAVADVDQVTLLVKKIFSRHSTMRGARMAHVNHSRKLNAEKV